MNNSIYIRVQNHARKAAELMFLDESVTKRFFATQNEVIVNFPVKLDNGKVRVFTGFRVQHNNLLGPFKGGIRFHPAIEVDDMRALAMRISLQSALINLPFGGAMGGIAFDPANYTIDEVERISRRFAFALGANVGAEYDIIEPDVNTNQQIMAWFLDTHLMMIPPQDRNRNTHVVTGKPVKLGGSAVRRKATGLGIATLVASWAEKNGRDMTKLRFFVQGFGNVGAYAAKMLCALGAKMVAVEDATGPVANYDGIDPDALLDFLSKDRNIANFPHAHRVSHEAFMSTKADIFIPAALENQITGDTAPLLNVSLVAEGAHAPTTHEGDAILAEKGVHVIPDILCNAGGFIASYYEWLQNKRSELWDNAEVEEKLKVKMLNAYEKVLAKAKEHDTNMRIAAYIVALSRMRQVYTERGIFP